MDRREFMRTAGGAAAAMGIPVGAAALENPRTTMDERHPLIFVHNKWIAMTCEKYFYIPHTWSYGFHLFCQELKPMIGHPAEFNKLPYMEPGNFIINDCQNEERLYISDMKCTHFKRKWDPKWDPNAQSCPCHTEIHFVGTLKERGSWHGQGWRGQGNIVEKGNRHLWL